MAKYKLWFSKPVKSDHNKNFWYFQNIHIKTTKIFSVRSSPDPPIFKKNCSPIQSWSGQNWLQSWSSPDLCSSLQCKHCTADLALCRPSRCACVFQRWAESPFSDSDSTPAPRFKTPAPAPKNFETSTLTPVDTPKTPKEFKLKRYCLFCLMRQDICRGYFAFNRTQMVEMVTRPAQYRETQHVEV